MKRLIAGLAALVGLVVVAGCGGDADSTAVVQAHADLIDDGCSGAKNGSPCGADGDGFNTGACNAGTCVRFNNCALMLDGDICGGNPSDAYHGRCKAGLCAWADYQCAGQPNNASCASDFSPGTCQWESCCTFCVDGMGNCAITHATGGNGQDYIVMGGGSCP